MLMAFEDEYSLQKIVQKCHNVIWERQGHDPAQSFDELSKLLFLKLFDEMHSPKEPSTVIKPFESIDEYAKRQRRLFHEAANSEKYHDIFSTPSGRIESILADDRTIFEVMKALEPFSLIKTTSLSGIDIKGTIYEKMVGNTFRGQLGQFFTHRSIVQFMVNFLEIDENQVVYDPSCGSGGFLVSCIKHIRNKILDSEDKNSKEMLNRLVSYSENKLFGTEINTRTARVAKINLMMHGMSHKRIYNINALKIFENHELSSIITENSFDVILSNPPFAGYEKDACVLEKFELGKNSSGLPKSTTREVLFIERIIRLLKEQGVAGIVIPQGILTDKNLSDVRKYIRKNAQILAIIELPDWAFIPSGTSVRGSLLFIRKIERPPRNYYIFMKKVQKIGFTSTGRSTEENDLPHTILDYKKGKKYRVSINEVTYRIDAKFYTPEKISGCGDYKRHFPDWLPSSNEFVYGTTGRLGSVEPKLPPYYDFDTCGLKFCITIFVIFVYEPIGNTNNQLLRRVQFFCVPNGILRYLEDYKDIFQVGKNGRDAHRYRINLIRLQNHEQWRWEKLVLYSDI